MESPVLEKSEVWFDLCRDMLATLTEVTFGPKGDDPIDECGQPALSLLEQNPNACMQLAYQKLHDTPYGEVSVCWRRLYTDAALKKVIAILEEILKSEEPKEMVFYDVCVGIGNVEEGKSWIDAIVPILDKAVILTGAPRREHLITTLFKHIQEQNFDPDPDTQRPSKRQKLIKNPSCIKDTFPLAIHPTPKLRFPMLRIHRPSFECFQTKICASQTPFVITGAINDWPALGEEHTWNRPDYLLRQTLGGRRLIPVELGRSYTDEAWGQKLVSFREFMEGYMLREEGHVTPADTPTGYLAQHDLFAQIPSLRNDILIPDYCYTTPPAPASSPQPEPPESDEPLLNAWFGPRGTISPLHTDCYHNIFAQVVGYKYIRMYAPSDTPRLYPRGVEDTGVNMSNTSLIDLDRAMGLFEEINSFPNEDGGKGGEDKEWENGIKKLREEFQESFPGFLETPYLETVLGPGECLYLPRGWWHYVRSLSPSFSVSFWWN